MRPSKKSGFTLVEVMVVVGIIALLASIAIPNFLNSRNRSRLHTCQSNLRAIDQAKYQFAFENSVADGGAITSTDISPTYLRQMPTCPSGGTYTVNNLGTAPTCTINSGAFAHVMP